jgi:hypothetical protein
VLKGELRARMQRAQMERDQMEQERDA